MQRGDLLRNVENAAAIATAAPARSGEIEDCCCLSYGVHACYLIARNV